MGMTKKDFNAIAEILKEFSVYREKTEKETSLNLLIVSFSDYFKSVNPLFDKERFLTVCLK